MKLFKFYKVKIKTKIEAQQKVMYFVLIVSSWNLSRPYG